MLESNSDTIWNKERLAVVFNKKIEIKKEKRYG